MKKVAECCSDELDLMGEYFMGRIRDGKYREVGNQCSWTQTNQKRGSQDGLEICVSSPTPCIVK